MANSFYIFVLKMNHKPVDDGCYFLAIVEIAATVLVISMNINCV